MADEWSRFGLIERIGLATILFVLGALLAALISTQARMAGVYSPEYGQVLHNALGLYIAGVILTTMGGPVLRPGWNSIRARLSMSQNA